MKSFSSAPWFISATSVEDDLRFSPRSHGSPFFNGAKPFGVRRGGIAALKRLRFRAALEASFCHAPVDVGKEGLDIFRSLRWLIVEQVRVFTHIHDQHRIEAVDVADFVRRNPVIRQALPRRVSSEYAGISS